MRNLNLLNKELNTLHATHAANGEVCVNNFAEECAAMEARGRAKVFMNELATKLTGSYIHKLNDVVTEEEITPLIMNSKKKPTPQSLNATMKMVACYSLIQSGYINAKTIETALNNWIDQDGICTEQTLDTNAIALDLMTEIIKAELVEDQEDQAFIEGAYFAAYGLTETMNINRVNVMNTLWANAEPMMKPLSQPVTWNDNGVCELNNLKMIKGKSKPTAAQVINNKLGVSPFVEALNRMNHTGYRINNAIRVELELWLEAGEMPELAEDEKLAMKQMREHDAKVAIIEELLTLPVNEVFYFAHTADYRGRVYPRGGMTQYQSIKEAKAIFDFAEEVEVKDVKGLYLHVANAHDMDKVSITDRIAWVNENKEEIIAGTLSNNFYAKRAALALREVEETGKTAVICHIDGTCNGTQWTAAMYRDEKAGKHVNLLAATLDCVPQDLYGVIAARACKLLRGKELAAMTKFMRSLTKSPIMVLGYGASENTCENAVRDFLASASFNADAKKINKAIFVAIKMEAPSLTKLTNNLKRILKNAPRHSVTWDAFDLQVTSEYLSTAHLDLKGNSYSGKVLGKAEQDCGKLASGISPNYVHSMDSAHVRAIVRACNYGLSCIHDSIGCPANKVMETNEVIRETFVEINRTDLVENIYNALDKDYTQQRGNLNIDDVLEATYIFS